MLAGKGSCSHRVKSVAFQNISQLNQRVVKGPVPKGNHRHRQCTAAVYGVKVFKHEIWKPSRISRHTEDYQLVGAYFGKAFTHARQSKIVFIKACPQ